MPKIILASYDPEWPLRFKEIGAALRAALEPVLGDRLTGVHHIGSTSVPGLAAKPIIDVQVSIRDFRPWSRTDLVAPEEPVEKPSREHIGEDEALIDALESTGLHWLGDWCTDYRKWLLRRRDGLAVNCHVRRRAAPASSMPCSSATICASAPEPGSATKTSSASWPNGNGPASTTTPTRRATVSGPSFAKPTAGVRTAGAQPALTPDHGTDLPHYPSGELQVLKTSW
jgi:Uncharacterized conserved protein